MLVILVPLDVVLLVMVAEAQGAEHRFKSLVVLVILMSQMLVTSTLVHQVTLVVLAQVVQHHHRILGPRVLLEQPVRLLSYFLKHTPVVMGVQEVVVVLPHTAAEAVEAVAPGFINKTGKEQVFTGFLDPVEVPGAQGVAQVTQGQLVVMVVRGLVVPAMAVLVKYSDRHQTAVGGVVEALHPRHQVQEAAVIQVIQVHQEQNPIYR